MKKLTRIIIYWICSQLAACNLSDSSSSLPHGYLYVKEGQCYHYIIGGDLQSKTDVYIRHVLDYYIDKNYLFIAYVDTAYCHQVAKKDNLDMPFEEDSLKFTIVDTKLSRVIGCWTNESLSDSLRRKMNETVVKNGELKYPFLGRSKRQ